MPWSVASQLSARFDHERVTHPEAFACDPQTFVGFFYTTVYHSDFDPDWPISTDWAAVMRGLRGSFGASQAEFAQSCEIGRATVERWEAAKTIPFRGDALQILSLIRPMLRTDLQAGQALNLAAAAVLPNLTRPTAEYSGADLAGFLRSGKHDHTYLAVGLLNALVSARILVPIHFADDALDDTYFPLAARLQKDSSLPGWASELIDNMRALRADDRRLVLSLAKRLATEA
ncbi:hypothetical protein FBY26_3577 [Phycicoccus sp. SLBN-51]|nr:hypothetical protein FBY26_3577 [Phycicoccus sp. SLBN-51]